MEIITCLTVYQFWPGVPRPLPVTSQHVHEMSPAFSSHVNCLKVKENLAADVMLRRGQQNRAPVGSIVQV